MSHKNNLTGIPCLLVMSLAGIMCVVLCCIVAWVGISIIDEDADVQEPQVLVDTEVTIDTASLPENPTIADWYPIGLQVLQDNGWDLSPNLTSIGVVTSCGSSLVLDRVQLDFVDRYFDGFRPSVKWGRVSLDRHSNTASVHISYQALQWVWLSGIDLAGVKVGAQEALEIADRYEGQKYRENANEKCKMAIDLGSSGWRIRYRENDGSRWEDWAIWVDAETGAVKIE